MTLARPRPSPPPLAVMQGVTGIQHRPENRRGTHAGVDFCGRAGHDYNNSVKGCAVRDEHYNPKNHTPAARVEGFLLMAGAIGFTIWHYAAIARWLSGLLD